MSIFDRLRRVSGKLAANARVLREDPERFARTVTQFTHPALFERRLIGITNAGPMHVAVQPVGPRLRLNVLDQAWTRSGMTGGPNTMVNLACRVARSGIPVRLVSTSAPVTLDPAWFAEHAAALAGAAPEIGLASASDPVRPLPVGPGDVFLATHWSTAQQLRPVLPRLTVGKFFYMLQEFEPGFYAWSSDYALALETLGLDFWPIVNEGLLAEFLFAQPHGRLPDPATRAAAMVFEPAVDAAVFHPGEAPGSGATHAPKRLLFYARPTNPRNLFGLGLTALRAVAAEPVFAGWEFLSIGGRGGVPDLPLGGGHVLRPAPWMGYAGYADLLRSADVLLCPMLSPHTSYPVLEMAACGGLSVTNVFATKTEAALAALSDNILAGPATVDGFAAALRDAADRVNAGRPRGASLRMPRDWAETLDPVAAQIAAIVRTAMQPGV